MGPHDLCWTWHLELFTSNSGAQITSLIFWYAPRLAALWVAMSNAVLVAKLHHERAAIGMA